MRIFRKDETLLVALAEGAYHSWWTTGIHGRGAIWIQFRPQSVKTGPVMEISFVGYIKFRNPVVEIVAKVVDFFLRRMKEPGSHPPADGGVPRVLHPFFGFRGAIGSGVGTVWWPIRRLFLRKETQRNRYGRPFDLQGAGWGVGSFHKQLSGCSAIHIERPFNSALRSGRLRTPVAVLEKHVSNFAPVHSAQER